MKLTIEIIGINYVDILKSHFYGNMFWVIFKIYKWIMAVDIKLEQQENLPSTYEHSEVGKLVGYFRKL